MKKPFYTRPRISRDILTFAHPFDKDGNPRVYTSILLYLHENVFASKKEILINALGRTEAFYKSEWYTQNPGLCHPTPFAEGGDRGYLSSMFSDLHAAGLIEYHKKMKVWSLGPRYGEWKEWLRRDANAPWVEEM